MRHQAGDNFAREISIAASAATPFGLIIPGTTLYADAPEDNRQDNITVIDIRAEKTVTLGARIKLRGFFDLFNIANSSAAETSPARPARATCARRRSWRPARGG